MKRKKENYKSLKLLTIKEVCELFSVRESKIRRAILNREIPYVKIGGLVRFRAYQLELYLEQQSK